MKSNAFNLDFIGIGAEKAASTWVADCLSEHPQICMSEPKEIHFFNDRLAYIWKRKNDRFEKGVEWYEKYFMHCKEGNLRGEFSTHYLPDVKAPARMHSLFPDVKILITLRDPVKRAISQYNMYRYYFKKESREFDTVIREESEYIEKGLYMKQIKRWLKYYKKEQLHIILADDVKQNPNSVIKNLYNFLGVDDSFIPQILGEKSNAAKEVRSPFISSFMGIFTRTMVALKLGAIVKWLKGIGLKGLVQKVNTKKMETEEISEKTQVFLYKKFKADIRELEKFLDRSLDNWKYDE